MFQRYMHLSCARALQWRTHGFQNVKTHTHTHTHTHTKQNKTKANKQKKRPCPLRFLSLVITSAAWWKGERLALASGSFSFSSKWRRNARKGPHALRPVSQQSPQGCPRNRANVCLVEHRSFPTLEGGMTVASFLHSSFF